MPETITAVKEELDTGKYDLIHAETFYMMPHIPETKVPTILAEQTIEYLGYESYARNTKWFFLKPFLYFDIAKIKHWEKHYWNSCTKLIVMSEDDKNFVTPSVPNPEKIEVVSNGVDTKWFAEKKKQLPDDPTILSVGTFKWLPNVEAVNYLIEKVWPKIKQSLPKTKLWIVGNAPTKDIFAHQDRDSSITVTGGIPDIRDAFNGAHVLVAPVFSGKGTRYKILEAMASRTPIVATDIAVEGLGVENGVHVLTGNTPQALAKQTIKLLQQPSLQEKLAKNGKAFVSKYYDWDTISKKLDAIYKDIGSQPRETSDSNEK